MTDHKKYKKYKKYKKHSEKDSEKDSSSNYKSTSCKPHPKPYLKPYLKPYPKPHCGCEQLLYSPLPNLPSRPPTQTVTPGEWFSPGSVQSCCSICSSVKPVYASPCTGYCSRQY